MITNSTLLFISGPQLRSAACWLGRWAEVRSDARRDRREDGRGRDSVSCAALVPARHRLLRHGEGHGIGQSGMTPKERPKSNFLHASHACVLMIMLSPNDHAWNSLGCGQERPQLSQDDDKEICGRDSSQRRRGRKQQRKVNRRRIRSRQGLSCKLSQKGQKAQGR